MASRSGAVQFKGVDKVIRAYEANKVPAWAVFSGTQLLFKYEGEPGEPPEMEMGKAFLKEVLESITEDNSIATYTLRVYEDLPKGEKIKSNTAYDGSFNFKLMEGSYPSERLTNRLGQVDSLQDQIASMQETINGLVRRLEGGADSEDEKPVGVMGMLTDTLGGIMQNEAVERAIAGKLVDFIDGLFKPKNTIPMQQDNRQIAGKVEDEHDQIAKVNQAISILWPHDQQLGDHLLQLAAIVQKDPSKMKTIVNSLKFFA